MSSPVDEEKAQIVQESIEEFVRKLDASLTLHHYCQYNDAAKFIEVAQVEYDKALNSLRKTISKFTEPQTKLELEDEFKRRVVLTLKEYESERDKNTMERTEEFLKELVRDISKHFKSRLELQILLAPDMGLERVEKLVKTEKECAIRYFDEHSNYGYVGMVWEQKRELEQELEKIGRERIVLQRSLLSMRSEEESLEKLKQAVLEMLRQVKPDSGSGKQKFSSRILKSKVEEFHKSLLGDYGEIYSNSIRIETEESISPEEFIKWAEELTLEPQFVNEKGMDTSLPEDTINLEPSEKDYESYVEDTEHDIDIDVKIGGVVVEKSAQKPDHVVKRSHQQSIGELNLNGEGSDKEVNVRNKHSENEPEGATANDRERAPTFVSMDTNDVNQNDVTLKQVQQGNERQNVNSSEEEDFRISKRQKPFERQPLEKFPVAAEEKSVQTLVLEELETDDSDENLSTKEIPIESSEERNSQQLHLVTMETNENGDALLPPRVNQCLPSSSKHFHDPQRSSKRFEGVNARKLNVPDQNGDSPLLRSIRNGESVECISKIVKAGANINIKRKNGGSNAAHEVITSLLEKSTTTGGALAGVELGWAGLELEHEVLGNQWRQLERQTSASYSELEIPVVSQKEVRMETDESGRSTPNQSVDVTNIFEMDEDSDRERSNVESSGVGMQSQLERGEKRRREDRPCQASGGFIGAGDDTFIKRPHIQNAILPGCSTTGQEVTRNTNDCLIFWPGKDYIEMALIFNGCYKDQFSRKKRNIRWQVESGLKVDEKGHLNCARDHIICLFNLIQRSLKEVCISFKVGGKKMTQEFTIEFLLGFLLKLQKESAQSNTESTFDTALIIVPMWLTSLHRIQFKDAALIAGFRKVHLLNAESIEGHIYAFERLKQKCVILVLGEVFDVVSAVLYESNGKNLTMIADKYFDSKLPATNFYDRLKDFLSGEIECVDSGAARKVVFSSSLPVLQGHGMYELCKELDKFGFTRNEYGRKWDGVDLESFSLLTKKKVCEIYKSVREYYPGIVRFCREDHVHGHTTSCYYLIQRKTMFPTQIKCELPLSRKIFQKEDRLKIIQDCAFPGGIKKYATTIALGEMAYKGNKKLLRKHNRNALQLTIDISWDAIVSINVNSFNLINQVGMVSQMPVKNDFAWSTPYLGSGEREKLTQLVHAIAEENQKSCKGRRRIAKKTKSKA